MDSATIEKVATTVVIAGAAFAASKLFEAGWKLATGRPIPAEDADDVTMASLVLFAASSAAIAAVGASIIERAGFLKLCRNPKFIAYVVVLVYSMARAVPVMYVPHFRGDWRILWAIDMITAIPYTWGLIEMVAGQKLWHRIVGAATAAVTFLAPYVYFLMYGRHAPPGVWTAIAFIFFGGIFLEVFRYRRDRAVKKGLAEQAHS